MQDTVAVLTAGLAAVLALAAAALGEALGRLPADAATAAGRGEPPCGAGRLLADAIARSLAVLIASMSAIAVTGGAPPAALATALLPLAAAPVTAAPLLGAPLRLGLLAWCAVRVLEVATPLAAIAGLVAGLGVWTAIGPRRLGATLRQTGRDTISVLAAAPIAVPACVPLLVGLTLAPWELLRRCRRPLLPPPAPQADPTGALSIVYLDGVGKTWRPPTTVARELVAELRTTVPDARYVTDVLPYSPLQVPLTDRPGSGRAWRWLRRRAFGMLVGRNILQTVVVSDGRYQAAFGAALAGAIVAALDRAGHRRGDRVALVGYSGGAVVGVAAADALATTLGGGDLVVVSVGGYLDGRVLPRRAVVHHLVSVDDAVERLGRAMFPARWRIARSSAWNRAIRDGSVVLHRMVGSRHIGPSGYLSGAARGPDGASHLRHTAGLAAGVLDLEQ